PPFYCAYSATKHLRAPKSRRAGGSAPCGFYHTELGAELAQRAPQPSGRQVCPELCGATRGTLGTTIPRASVHRLGDPLLTGLTSLFRIVVPRRQFCACCRHVPIVVIWRRCVFDHD